MNFWLFLCLLLLISGCESRIDQFTAGKLESLCRVSLPICQTRVTCVLDEESFIAGDFPGSQSILLYAQHPKNKLKLKILLSEQVYPGTEFLIRVYDVGCASLQEEQLKNVDLFMRAGDDQILDFEFDFNGLGDHLIEVFSDMNAHYQLIVEIEPQFAQ
jgi:hypothetical protein